MKSEETKKLIVQHTIELIRQGDGNIESLTIRKIAESAGISVGLVNHYFTTKDALIEFCVQLMIADVVKSYRVGKGQSDNPVEVTKTALKGVMDYLMDNQQISRISILSDLKNPMEEDNTMGTVKGIAYCLSGGTITQEAMQKAYAIISILQESFLRRESLKASIGVDFNHKEERNEYINWIVDRIADQREEKIQ